MNRAGSGGGDNASFDIHRVCSVEHDLEKINMEF